MFELKTSNVLFSYYFCFRQDAVLAANDGSPSLRPSGPGAPSGSIPPPGDASPPVIDEPPSFSALAWPQGDALEAAAAGPSEGSADEDSLLGLASAATAAASNASPSGSQGLYIFAFAM